MRGGPTHAVLNTVKALRERGVDAQIATTNDDGPERVLDVPVGRAVEYENVPIRFFPRFSPKFGKISLAADKAFLFSPALTRWLWQHPREYDLVETRYLFSYPSTCARVIARWQGIPYIVHPTGQLASWALAQSRLKKRLYSQLLEHHHLQGAAAIQCSSHGEVEDVRDFGIATPTFVVPVGVNPPTEIPNARQKLRDTHSIPAGTPIVLFLSRIHPKKRPDLLVRALSQLATRDLDFHLLVAGSGDPDYLNYLERLVVSSGLSQRVSFVGFVGGQEKELLLQGSDLFVLPSYSENFGVAVVEAMAAGLPVVMTPGIQIASDVAAAEAGLVVEGEPEPLSEALARLLAFPELREKLGQNGKQLTARRYSWEVIAKDLIATYSAIVQHGRLPKNFSSESNP